MTLRLRHANQDAMTGLIIALSGWFVEGFAHLVGNGLMVGLAFVMAIIAALLAVVLGAQVLNLRRVPAWARPYVGNPPPSLALGAAAIIIALSLFFGAPAVVGKSCHGHWQTLARASGKSTR